VDVVGAGHVAGAAAAVDDIRAGSGVKASARSMGSTGLAGGAERVGQGRPSTCSAAKTGVARAKSRVPLSSSLSSATLISL